MNDCQCIEQLKEVLRATEIHDWSYWSWFRERNVILRPGLKRALPVDTLRLHLTRAVQEKLYSHFYCKGFATPARALSARLLRLSAEPAFLDELSDANQGRGYLEPGWQVIGQSEIEVTFEKNGIRCHMRKDPSLSHNAPVTNGMAARRYMPKELRFVSPGFLTVLGNESLPSGEDTTIVRFYWNLQAEGAATLVQVITAKFNEAQLPFRLKILNHPNQFTRCDAAILYTAKDWYFEARNILEIIYPDLRQYLKPEIPVFTKPLSFGLGLAEDPAGGVSFGTHRCQILAREIIRAFELGKKSLEDRMEIIQDGFAESNICLEKPYLNPGSQSSYEFEPTSIATVRKLKDCDISLEVLLQTALEIGETLTASAIWHEQRCNWLGFEFAPEDHDSQNPPSLTYRTLGPGLYAGTSGVALFLAELYTATGYSALRRASLGAIRQALSATNASSSLPALGLYGGVLGIALVAAYIGRLLDEEEPLQSAARLVSCALQHKPKEHCSDLISGNAGAIVSLLILKDLLENDKLMRSAARLGDELLKVAHRKRRYCSWKSAILPKQKNLLGFSHGTAGIGYALFELYRATHDAKYRELGESAFRYERHWYNQDANNWPDFRGVPAHTRNKGHPVAMPVFWCHGAGGIALSRLRAYTILPEESCRSEAVVALTTTKLATERMVAAGPINFSLCHGLGGNGDILATGSQILGNLFPAGRDTAMKVAASGINWCAQGPHRWSSDLVGSRSPALMTGISGIGYFYLRLYDPEVPSVLLLEPDCLLRRSKVARK